MAINLSKSIQLKLAFTIMASFLFLSSVTAQVPEFALHYEDHQAVKLWVVNVDTARLDDLNIKMDGNIKRMLLERYIENDTIWLEPLVPFNLDVTYRLMYYGSDYISDEGILIGTFQGEKTSIVPANLDILPAIKNVPVNLLKMHLEFDRPMQIGNSYRFIEVYDSNDSLVKPFLEIQPELWNEDKTVLTLWLDPGRIKRDLIRNTKLGEPLKVGERYVMAVDSAWQDYTGQSLEEIHFKPFTVVAPLRSKVATKNWKYQLLVGSERRLILSLIDQWMKH